MAHVVTQARGDTNNVGCSPYNYDMHTHVHPWEIARHVGNLRKGFRRRRAVHSALVVQPRASRTSILPTLCDDTHVQGIPRCDKERSIQNRTLKDDPATAVHKNATADSQCDIGMASISRLAMYNTGSTLGSHAAAHMSRASIYQQKNPGTIGTRGARSLTSTISSVLVIAITLGTAVFAAVRSKLKAVRDCSACQGYGVQRCKLCSGKGTIDWEGKMAHREPCPMCLGRRLIKCTQCGGGILFSRSLFIHKSNKGEDALMETLQTLTTPSMKLFGTKTPDVHQEARLAESDEYSKEILSD